MSIINKITNIFPKWLVMTTVAMVIVISYICGGPLSTYAQSSSPALNSIVNSSTGTGTTQKDTSVVSFAPPSRNTKITVNDTAGLWDNNNGSATFGSAMTELQCEAGFENDNTSNFYCRGKFSSRSNEGYYYASGCTRNTSTSNGRTTIGLISCTKTIIPSAVQCIDVTDPTQKSQCISNAKDRPQRYALDQSSGSTTDQSTSVLKNVTNAAKASADAKKAVADKEAECNSITDATKKAACVAEIANLQKVADSAADNLAKANEAANPKKKDGGDGGIFAWIANIVLGLLSLLLWLVIQFAKFVLGVMGGMFVVLVSINPASNELLNVAYRPWQSVVNISNIFLIAGIIFMGFGYILNLDFIKKSQGLQNFFLGLLTIGVMMQFTFAATAGVVNFTNGVGNIIYFGAGGLASESVAPDGSKLRQCLDNIKSSGDSGIGFVNTFICSVSQVSPITSADAASGDGLNAVFDQMFKSKGASAFVTTAIALAIFVLAIISFWKVLVILLVRIFGLWILIVISPLALVAAFSPLPQMKDISSKWLDNFMRLSFSYPFYTFGITLVTLMIGSVSTAIQESAQRSGFSSLPAGSIDTYAQGLVGSGDEAELGRLIGVIMVAVFCLGLVWGFGVLFTKVFGAIYDAVAKAAGVAMAATRGTLSAGKGFIGGGLGIASRLSSGAGDKLKTLGDKLATNPNSNFRSKGLGNLLGGLGNSLKTTSKGFGIAKNVSDLGFDATRFALDAPEGIINAGKKIYGGFKKSSDKTTRQNGQLISDYAERTMRRFGMDKEADLMDDPTYKGMGRDQFKDERWNKLADPKSFSNALMRYGVPPAWANSIAENFGKETQATRRQAKANRKRDAEYSMDFEGLDDDDRIELMADGADKLGLAENKSLEENLELLKNISPEEYNVAKGIFESLADRPEVLAKMALDKRFQALAQTVYGSMTDDVKNKFKFSGMNLLGDKDVAEVLSSLSPSDKKKLEPSSLKDPRIKAIYEKFNSDYDSVLDKSERFKQLDGSQTVSEGAFSMGNKSAKRAYVDKVKGSNLDAALSAINRESKSLSAVNSSAAKDLFAAAYEHSEYDATTGKHSITATGDEVLKNSYKQLLTNQFGTVATDSSGNIDVSRIQNAKMSDLLATQAGSEIAAIYNSTFSDVDINSKEGEQLYKAMYHSVMSTTVNGQGEAIASAKLTADTLNDVTRKSATENIVIDEAKKGMDALHASISSAADFDTAIQSLTQKLDIAAAPAQRQSVLQSEGKAVAVESANAIAKAIARGETGGAVIGDSMTPIISRAIQKVQSATSLTGAREAMAEVGQNIKTLTDQINNGGPNMSPTKLAELKATKNKLMSINQGIAQVIEVYHGNQALVSNTTGVITAKVADEIKKAGQRFNVKTEDGSALDKGKMQEVLASEKQKLTEKQKTNREKIRSSIPNEETVTSVFEVLRGAANTTTPTQGRLRSKIKQNIGADLLNKA